jgi:RecJ-like exonuclease
LNIRKRDSSTFYPCKTCDGEGVIVFTILKDGKGRYLHINILDLDDALMQYPDMKYDGENQTRTCFKCNGTGSFDWIDNITKNKDRSTGNYSFRYVPEEDPDAPEREKVPSMQGD